MAVEVMDPGDKRIDIERKLEKERNKLKVLRENVAKSNQITNSITGILSSFEQRLGRLEETILPVYNETGNLQRRQQNIERALASLDHVISYYSIAEEVDNVVRTGPIAVGLDEYISVMNKLKNALIYFEKNNPQSVELDNVSTLFNDGMDKLCREFKETLTKHSRSIPPITLLDMVATDDDISDDVSVGSATGLPESVTSELSTLASWLLSQGRTEILESYSKLRGAAMLKSINQLREQHKSGSGSSVQGFTQHSPSMRPKFPKHETPGRSASKRLQAVFEKKANKMLLKASQTIENSTGLTIGGRRGTVIHLENREDIVDEQEMEGYLMCVIAVQRLMQAERSLMSQIIPSQYHNSVFQSIVQESVDTIVQNGENIAMRAKRCISRHEFGSVIVVMAILKNLVALQPEFEKTTEACDFNVRSQFSSIINTLQTTALKGLEEVLESLRSESNSGGLPKDGTVHELTSNMLVLLSHLVDYKDTLGKVLGGESAYINALSQITPKPQDTNSALLGIYIKKVVSQLNYTLVSKSENYPEPGVRSLFRLNNCHHVLKALQRSCLLSLVQICEPDCQSTYLDMIHAHKKAYQTCWNKVLSHISNLDDIPIAPGKMKDKDRNAIKEKFAGFNKEMEDISKLQRGYSIPDVELRESLKRDNKEYVLPKYNAFYDRYSNVPFTKNPEKYVKYTPDKVASMIDRFFDLAA